MSVKRIALGQLWQEQNTFSPVKTVLEDFEQFGLYYGEEIIDRFSETNELGGFITTLKARKDTRMIPAIRAWSWPKGNVAPGTYKIFKDEIAGRIRAAMPLDGVLFSFHGAMVSDSQFDVEGDILNSIRKETGMDIPVVISCDLHANITQDMLKYADYIEGYHTCPHVDLFRTGKKAALILSELLDGARLDTGFVKLPLITPARAHDSSRHPFKTLFGWLDEVEKEPGIKGASLFPVQPWLDVPGTATRIQPARSSITRTCRAYPTSATTWPRNDGRLRIWPVWTWTLINVSLAMLHLGYIGLFALTSEPGNRFLDTSLRVTAQ